MLYCRFGCVLSFVLCLCVAFRVVLCVSGSFVCFALSFYIVSCLRCFGFLFLGWCFVVLFSVCTCVYVSPCVFAPPVPSPFFVCLWLFLLFGCVFVWRIFAVGFILLG